MSIGDCSVPLEHGGGQFLGPRDGLDGPYDVKCANRLCSVSFIDSKRFLATEGAKVYVRGRALLKSEARECTA